MNTNIGKQRIIERRSEVGQACVRGFRVRLCEPPRNDNVISGQILRSAGRRIPKDASAGMPR